MSEEKDSGPTENADKSQEVSSIYIPFPVTDGQAARMYSAYCASELPSRGEATEAALRVVGIEITPPPEDLKPVSYVNAQRLLWKLSTGSSVCLTFSAEPWHGGGSQDLIDGIVFSKDHESVVRHLNVCLSEYERAILGLTDQIAEKDRRIAELEGEIALARQSPAPPLKTESGEHEGDGATSALSDTLRAASGKAANDIRNVLFVTDDEGGPRLVTIKPSFFRLADHLSLRETCEELVKAAYSLSRTAGMSSEDVVRLTVGRLYDGASQKMPEDHIFEADVRGREERSHYPQAPLMEKTVSGDDAECNPRVLAAAKAMCLACYSEDLWDRIPNQEDWIHQAELALSAADAV